MATNFNNKKPEGMVSFSSRMLDDSIASERATNAFINSQARTQNIKDETALRFPKFGGGEGVFKNLSPEIQGYYSNVLDIVGQDTMPFAKIPSTLMPKLLTVMQQGGAYKDANGIKEFIGTVEQAHARNPKEAEKFLDTEQKRLSKQKAKDESDVKAYENEQRSAKAASQAAYENKQKEVAAVQSVRDEYAGMSPDEVIAHYSSKYKTAMTNSPSSSKQAVSRMDDEIDQMAASKLGRKYSREKGLY
jgi:hypothetical protein